MPSLYIVNKGSVLDILDTTNTLYSLHNTDSSMQL